MPNLIPTISLLSGVPNTSWNADPGIKSLDVQFAVTQLTASGAMAVAPGLYVLNAASALAMTLAVPTPGLPSAGGKRRQRSRGLRCQRPRTHHHHANQRPER